jgi:hypothetical protein
MAFSRWRLYEARSVPPLLRGVAGVPISPAPRRVLVLNANVGKGSDVAGKSGKLCEGSRPPLQEDVDRKVGRTGSRAGKANPARLSDSPMSERFHPMRYSGKHGGV